MNFKYLELKEDFKLIEATPCFQEEENRVENFHHYFYTSLICTNFE